MMTRNGCVRLADLSSMGERKIAATEEGGREQTANPVEMPWHGHDVRIWRAAGVVIG